MIENKSNVVSSVIGTSTVAKQMKYYVFCVDTELRGVGECY